MVDRKNDKHAQKKNNDTRKENTMKKKVKFISLLLGLALCLGLCVPAFAVNETNAAGAVFSVALSEYTLTRSSEEQTVTMALSANKSLAVSFGSFDVKIPEGWVITEAIAPTDKFICTVNKSTGFVSWEAKEATDLISGLEISSFGTVTYTIPANAAAGKYILGVEKIYAGTTPADVEGTEEGDCPAYATATLTITDGSSDAGYTAGLSTDASSAAVGEAVAVKVNAAHKSSRKYAAAEMRLSYDKDKLSFVSVVNAAGEALNSGSVVNDAANGTLTFEDYGADKDLKNGIYTVNFTAKAKGTAAVTLTGASLSDKANAEKSDLTVASIDSGVQSVSIEIIKNYGVTLPSESWIHGASTVEDGADYSFSVDDHAYYDYSVSATVGGAAATLTNTNGVYKIAAVGGEVVVTASRTAKQHDITFTTTSGVELPKNTKGSYGTDFSFDLPAKEHYSVSITSAKYSDGTVVSYENSSGHITIRGSKLTDSITIVIDQVQTDASVSVEGNAASDAAGYVAYATPGTDYVLTVTEDAKYDYTVTAAVNGVAKTVTAGADGKYTLAGTDVKAGTIVFTVNKALKPDGVTVSKYLQLDGTAMWLIKNTVSKLDGSVYQYDGSAMFWSADYNAYCYLVIAETAPTVEAAAAKLTLASGSAVEISGFDVNKTGRVDANDAQLVYNMYAPLYSDFTEDVTMEKFLLADTNHSGTVTVDDVVAIIREILQ